MNPRHNENLREKLSAEYVLGTLKHGARRRFEVWLRDDVALQRAVAEWQDRLHPIGRFAPAVQPPARVWQAIERQLNGQHRRSFWQGLRTDLRFWRGLGMTSTALAIVLASVLLRSEMNPPASPAIYVATYVATLSDDKAQPIAVVTSDVVHRQLIVKVLAYPGIAADKSLELWAVPKAGYPRSLGLLAVNGNNTLPLPENVTPQSSPLLAVTLEPKGGSPNPAGPTGPIVFKGPWVQL
jgi:anti-sigma-K factor RskA